MTLPLHPLCTLFPRLEGREFDTLVDDIRSNGLREPIITHEGMILDGSYRDWETVSQSRYRASL